MNMRISLIKFKMQKLTEIIGEDIYLLTILGSNLLILSTQQSIPEDEKLFPSVLFKIVHLYFILWINVMKAVAGMLTTAHNCEA